MRRRTLLTGGAAAAASSFRSPARSQARRSEVLRFVPQFDVTILDPVLTTAYVTRNHALMVWDQLYGFDSQLRPQPQMVEGHIVENDGRLWTFRLRDGLRFHDGEPVRGRDCVASIRRWAVKDGLGQALLARTDEMRALDDRSFAIRLKRPFGAMLDTLAKLGPPALVVMPERLAETDPSQAIKEVIGSGPFRFNAGERMVGSRVVYDRNPDYRPRESGVTEWAAGPKRVHFDRVEWHVMPDGSTAAAALQQGEIDWWENPSNDLLPALERRPEIVTRLASRLGTMGTGIFNHLHPPFDKAAVRRVVLEAMSQEDYMIAVAGTDPALRRTGIGIFNPVSPMASDAGLEAITRPRNLAASRKALAEAGYRGEPVLLMAAGDSPAQSALGDVTNDLLTRLGMTVDYAVSDWGTVVTRRASKAPPDKGGWNMFNTTWAGLDMVNPAVEQVLRCGGEKGFFGWPDIPRIEELREAWLDAPNEAAQKAIAAELQTVAMREVPYVPTGQYFGKTAYRRSLRDVVEGLYAFWGVRRV